MNGEPYTWHFVMVRAGQPIARGERLATFSLSAEDVDRIGLARVRKAVDAERAQWARRVIAAGYVDGYGVSVHAERGYRRSIFPSVHVAGLASAAPAPIVPGSAILAGGPIRSVRS